MNSFIICLFFVITSLSNAQNFRYKMDDWYVLKRPGRITAISENRFSIYFASDNGIYIYDKGLEDFRIDNTLSKFENFYNIEHFHYDPYHDYFWVVDGKSVNFKSSVSSMWRELDIHNTDIVNIYNIDRIGSSSQYFWIESFGKLYPFDPLSSQPAKWEEAELQKDFINWSSENNSFNNSSIDISRFSIDGDWTVGLDGIFDKNGRRVNVTVHLEDDEGHHWYGTDSGFILKGWSYSSRLEVLEIGLPFNDITVAYFDNENWWFADSKFRRTGKISTTNNVNSFNVMPFLGKWNEADNSWKYYYSNESISIENTDINSIINVGNIIYFGTMSGLLYLDIYNNEWNIIDRAQGLNDNAVWDMIEHNGSIYLATSNGINEVSLINQSVISDSNDPFLNLKNVNIYDLESDSVNLYIASNIGLLEFGWNEEEMNTLSKRVFKNIRLKNGTIFGADDALWSIGEYNNEQLIDSNVQSFDMCGSFLWKSNEMGVTLLDTTTTELWSYGYKDGIPGNKIYEVNCDEDWAWFLTNKGMAFYNWSKYH